MEQKTSWNHGRLEPDKHSKLLNFGSGWISHLMSEACEPLQWKIVPRLLFKSEPTRIRAVSCFLLALQSTDPPKYTWTGATASPLQVANGAWLKFSVNFWHPERMVCEEIFSINHAPLHWSLTNGADLENDVDRVEKLGQHDITSSTKNNMDALNYVGKLVLNNQKFYGSIDVHNDLAQTPFVDQSPGSVHSKLAGSWMMLDVAPKNWAKLMEHHQFFRFLSHPIASPNDGFYMWIQDFRLASLGNQVCPGRVGSALLTFSMHALQWAGSAFVVLNNNWSHDHQVK